MPSLTVFMLYPKGGLAPTEVEEKGWREERKRKTAICAVCCFMPQPPSPICLVFLYLHLLPSLPFPSLSSSFSSFFPSSFLFLFLFLLLLFPLLPRLTPSPRSQVYSWLDRPSGLCLGISLVLSQHGREDHLKGLKDPLSFLDNNPAEASQNCMRL